MSTTQIWMLCIILAMVFFMILTFSFHKAGQKAAEKETAEGSGNVTQNPSGT